MSKKKSISYSLIKDPGGIVLVLTCSFMSSFLITGGLIGGSKITIAIGVAFLLMLIITVGFGLHLEKFHKGVMDRLDENKEIIASIDKLTNDVRETVK